MAAAGTGLLMVEYMYAVAMLQTQFNGARMALMEDVPQLLFTDLQAAVDDAIENDWWPFVVERVEVRR